PLTRRSAGPDPGPGQTVPPQGAADLDRAALGAERGRHARAHPAAGEDHGRGATADRPARGVRSRARSGRGLRPHHAAHAGHARRAGRRAAPSGDRMRIVCPIEVSAPPEAVWEWVADPERYLHFFSGLTRWEVVSDEPIGLG